MNSVLVTGGAGFLGRHLCQRLAREGFRVTILDSLLPQVHGDVKGPPQELHGLVEWVKGDVRDQQVVNTCVSSADVVVHLAAETGVGQSMHEISRYVSTNVFGTANLLEAVARCNGRVQRLVVVSSRAVYGEGKYFCNVCGVTYPGLRSRTQLERAEWDVQCEQCGRELKPLATDEGTQLRPASIYGATKQAQEQLASIASHSFDIPCTILRPHNVFGPGQSLRNPYVGIISIFYLLLRSGQQVRLYEDGCSLRDFVYISDVTDALIRSLNDGRNGLWIYNVGTGTPLSIREVATTLAELMGVRGRVVVSGEFRAGDIRHCYADISAIGRELGYEPRISPREGLRKFVEWCEQEEVGESRLEDAESELRALGLMRRGRSVSGESHQ